MGTIELMKSLNLNPYTFYILKAKGVIPAPLSGLGNRKTYSPYEVAEIRKRVESLRATK